MSENKIERDLTEKILKWFKRPEVIAIKGPRQSGKTTLLKIIKSKLITQGVTENRIKIINLEDRRQLEQFEASPLEFIKSFLFFDPEDSEDRSYVFLDEYQYVKDGGQKLKLVFDSWGPRVKIIVTGSSSLELTQSLARFMVGRLLTAYLYPLNFGEFLRAKDKRLSDVWVKKQNLITDFLSESNWSNELNKDIFLKEIHPFWEEYVVYGGYPAVVNESDKEIKKDLLQALTETYIDKDIVRLLKEHSIVEFRNLVKILASQTGQLLNYNQLTSDSRLYYRKVRHYLFVLEETFIIKLLQPYYSNLTTELKKNPKIYFLDSGLRNILVNNFSDLDFRQDKGELAESVVLTNSFYTLSRGKEIKFWRTTGGAEIDFVIKQSDDLLFPVEIKYRRLKQPQTTKALISFIKTYSPKKLLVLTKSFWGTKKIEQTQILFVPVCYFSGSCLSG